MRRFLYVSLPILSFALLASARSTPQLSPAPPPPLTVRADDRPVTLTSYIRQRLNSFFQSAMSPMSATASNDISTGVIISDVIGKEQDIAIFSSLTRDIDAVSRRLDDATQNVTVLAPSNSVMKSLPRKPWENPKDYNTMGDQAYNGLAGEDRANANLRKFVEAHIVPASPWKEGEKVKTIAGNEVWYERRDGKTIIKPGDVEVTSVADKVGNGEIWVLDGVVNYS